MPLKIAQNENKQFLVDFKFSIKSIIENVLQVEVKEALHKTIKLARDINGHLSRQEPWKKNDLKTQKEDIILSYYLTVIALHLLEPVIPSFSSDLLTQLQAKESKIDFKNENTLRNLLNCPLKIQLPPSKKLITPLNFCRLTTE